MSSTLGGLAAPLLVACAVIALRAPLMDLPLERDEGGYAYIAWRLEAGEFPYRDWFDQKPPGIFLAYRAALELPLEPVVAIRALAALFGAASCVAVAWLVLPFGGPIAAALAAALLGLLASDPLIQGPVANTEQFMLPAMIAATGVVWRTTVASRRILARGIGAGALLGAAILFKPVAAVNLPFFVAVIACSGAGAGRWRAVGRFALGLALGLLVAAAPVALWLAWHGVLGDAIDAVLLHNLRYAAQLPLRRRLDALAYYSLSFLPSQGPAWALAVLGLARLWRCGAARDAAFLAGWAGVNALGVSTGGYYFPHYFQQLLPAFAAAGAAALAWRGAEARWRAAAVALGILAAAALLFFQLYFFRLTPDAAVRQIYPGTHFDRMPEIAEEVARLSGPQDRVFVFGAEPEILFHARRISASRYIYLFPLFGDYPEATERQRALARALEAADPPVIVEVANTLIQSQGGFLADWYRRYLDQHYRLHAILVTGADGRSEMVRVGSRRAAPDRSQRIWGRLYVREPRE